MPGVHLRTVGRFGNVEQEAESVLTVPGSYWLHHKKNIYKFTFKRHAAIKNIKEFSYARELMKVIRRIIKCQPCQGQQFGTRHILVTCNHIFWTRQDKMFAMLKFHDKSDIVAFPQAYILTVNIINTLEMCTSYAECINLASHKRDVPDERNTIYLEKSDDTVDSKNYTSHSHLHEYETSCTHEVDDQITLSPTRDDSLKEAQINSSQQQRVTSPTINSNAGLTSINKVQREDSNLDADLVKLKNNPYNECIPVIGNKVAKDVPADTNFLVTLEKSDELLQNVMTKSDETHENHKDQDKDGFVKYPITELNKEQYKSVSTENDSIQGRSKVLDIVSCTENVCDSPMSRDCEKNSSCKEDINSENYFQRDSNRIQPVEAVLKQTGNVKSMLMDHLEDLPLSERFQLQQTIELNRTCIDFKAIDSNKMDITDSTVLPYQYLIENEIKNSEGKSLLYTAGTTSPATDCEKLNKREIGRTYTDEPISLQHTFASSSWQINNVQSNLNKPSEAELKCTCHTRTIKNHKCDNSGASSRDDKPEKSAKGFHSKCAMKHSLNKFKRIKERSYAKVSKSERNVSDERNENDRELKIKPEHSIPRSSDITDLVMEGLMFTIKQDQDSVMVVEQKTKLELDEVLENSEKAETKEGEKCLLNSSLLKLENLITNIEMSKVEDKKLRKPKNILINDDISKLDAKLEPIDSNPINDEAIIKNKDKLLNVTLMQQEKDLLKDVHTENIEDNLKRSNTLYSDYESNSSKSDIESSNVSPWKLCADSLERSITLSDTTKDIFPCNKMNSNNEIDILKYNSKSKCEMPDIGNMFLLAGTSSKHQKNPGTSEISSLNFEAVAITQMSPFNLQNETTYFNDEEEDIVPEVFQHKIFRSSKVPEEQTNVLNDFKRNFTRTSKDLLMDDTDSTEQLEYNTDFLEDKRYALRTSRSTKCKRFLNPSKIVSTRNPKDNIDEEHFSNRMSELPCIKRNHSTDVNCVSKVPRVISDTILTNDQIPSNLQKALRSKLIKSKSNSKRKKKTSTNNSALREEYASGPNSLTSVTTQNVTLETSQESNSGISKSSNSSDIKIKVSSRRSRQEVFPSNDIEDTDASTSTAKITEKMLPLLHGMVPIKDVQLNVSENKEDITDDFYRDLMVRKKNKFTHNRRDLRERKRPSLETQSKTSENDKLYVTMWKLIQDITLGAKVVVKRISTPNITSVNKGESSFPVTGNNEDSTGN